MYKLLGLISTVTGNNLNTFCLLSEYIFSINVLPNKIFLKSACGTGGNLKVNITEIQTCYGENGNFLELKKE